MHVESKNLLDKNMGTRGIKPHLRRRDLPSQPRIIFVNRSYFQRRAENSPFPLHIHDEFPTNR